MPTGSAIEVTQRVVGVLDRLCLETCAPRGERGVSRYLYVARPVLA